MRDAAEDGTVSWNAELERWELDESMNQPGPPTHPEPPVAEHRPPLPEGPAQPKVTAEQSAPYAAAYLRPPPPVPSPRPRRSTALIVALTVGVLAAVLVVGVLAWS